MDRNAMIRKSAENWDRLSDSAKNEQVYFWAGEFLKENGVRVPEELNGKIALMLLGREKARRGNKKAD